METDRAVLAARIRDAHQSVLPTFAGGATSDIASIVVAEALATENITLTVAITSMRFDVAPLRWDDPAAAGTAVTVTVASTDTESGARRHVQLECVKVRGH